MRVNEMSTDRPAGTDGGAVPRPERAHGLERRVRESLMSDPALDVRNLQVRRTPGGLCLTGVVRGGDSAAAARIAAGLAAGTVLNRLVDVTDAQPA